MKELAQYTSRFPSPNFKRNAGPLGAGVITTPPISGESNSRTNKLTENISSEELIQQLRVQLDEATSRDKAAKTALSKSDAVILELRSNQRQLKRQVNTLQQERAEMSKELHLAKATATSRQGNNRPDTQQEEQINKNAKVGELQVQLDRAHAQILTADMVRKELEDTLEAEQYTWELRVQDQERQIARLQQNCDTLVRDLDECRSQWKEAEDGWTQELNYLKEQLLRSQSQSKNDTFSTAEEQKGLLQKINKLESERADLQSCLDEALLELEAVDAELQCESGENGPKGNNKDVTRKVDFYEKIESCDSNKVNESLKHLLRWIYQEGPVEKRLNHNNLSSLENDPHELVLLVQEALEGWLKSCETNADDKYSNTNCTSTNSHQATISELTTQIAMYEEELKIREESSSELRESLKEAVSLLKPLQDAVAESEEEKAGMKRQLRDSLEEISQQSYQINSLQDQLSATEKQFEDQKRVNRATDSLLKTQVSTIGSKATDEDESLTSIKRAREELRRKRETEDNLQKLLKDAQSRYQNLRKGYNEEDVSTKTKQHVKEQHQQDGGALADQNEIGDSSSLNVSFKKISSLEEELAQVRNEVIQHENENDKLNKSLKEALGLLKPLQMHLEEAEVEKTEISKELRNLRKRFRQLQMGNTDDQSKSTIGEADVSLELIKIKDELEETVRQLELENSQLHDAIEDLTEDGNKHDEAKMRQKLVELNSRYEVTQNKLEDAHVENHALVKALKQREINESSRKEEILKLKGNLKKTESELNNAKKIAQSALVKVEELTMTNIEQLSISRDASTVDGNDNNKNSDNHGAYSF